ncbi:MAG: phosphatidate cytidylyltransferase [Puniceicoccales bacterium]|jgi:phosphatidate cytidylyltransferase|nr:phosphatidate cytidylyltransferase [Puniceicoccales bacterium]
MGSRVLGSFYLLLLIAAVFAFFGNSSVVLLVTFFSIVSQLEFTRLLRRAGVDVFLNQVLFWTTLIPVNAWCMSSVVGGGYTALISAIFLTSCAVLSGDLRRITLVLPASLAALVCIPFTLQFAIVIVRSASSLPIGVATLAWVVAVCKLSDVGALLCGTLFGRHQLAPQFSPHKTWEGFYGGVAAALMAGHWLGIWLAIGLSVRMRLLLAVFLALLSTTSDLLESALKRWAGVKDSGACIPGIGGCLDLCDSFIFSLPGAYLFLLFAHFYSQIAS